jgi:HlyD family secretion protein
MNSFKSNQLQFLSEDELLPPASPWMTLGGFLLIGTSLLAILLASVLKYNVAVKAPATIRPTGELRFVQAAVSGPIRHIDVTANQSVRAGDRIAQIDDTNLQAQKTQIEGAIRYGEARLQQIDAQVQAVDTQIEAEEELTTRSVSEAEAELRKYERTYQELQVTTEADLQSANASLALARGELTRYRELQGTGAVSQLQVDGKYAAMREAEAKLRRVQAALNPIDAEVSGARERIAKAAADGAARLADLRRQKELLIQGRIELDNELLRTQKELQRVQNDLKRSVIRAPTSGMLLQLNIRNPGQVLQVGERVAFIAPLDAPLAIRAQVNAQDISKVRPNQPVKMRVSACPYPDYGVLEGVVTVVSPDALPSSRGETTNAAPQTGTTPSSPDTSAAQANTYEAIAEPKTVVLGSGDRQCRLQLGMEGTADIIWRKETVMQFVLRKARLLTGF